MDWDAIGAVGEIVGAAAVVVTLVYLSIQMKQNTAAVQSSRRENQFQTLSSWFAQLNDPVASKVWLAGIADYEALSPEERIQFHSIAMQIMLSYAQAQAFTEQGLYSKLELEPQEQWTVAFVNTNGGKAWFRASEGDWNPALKKHLAKLSEDTHQFYRGPLL